MTPYYGISNAGPEPGQSGPAVWRFFAQYGDILVAAVAVLSWLEMFFTYFVALTPADIRAAELARGKPVQVTQDQARRRKHGMVNQARNCGLFKRPMAALYLARRTLLGGAPELVTFPRLLVAQTMDPGLSTMIKDLGNNLVESKLTRRGTLPACWARWAFAAAMLLLSLVQVLVVLANEGLLSQSTPMVQSMQVYAALNACRFTWALSLLGALWPPGARGKVVSLWAATVLAKLVDILMVARAFWIAARLANAPTPDYAVGTGVPNLQSVFYIFPLMAGSCEVLVTLYGLGMIIWNMSWMSYMWMGIPALYLGLNFIYLVIVTAINHAKLSCWRYSMTDVVFGIGDASAC